MVSMLKSREKKSNTPFFDDGSTPALRIPSLTFSTPPLLFRHATVFEVAEMGCCGESRDDMDLRESDLRNFAFRDHVKSEAHVIIVRSPRQRNHEPRQQ